jgi:hypothetical protein
VIETDVVLDPVHSIAPIEDQWPETADRNKCTNVSSSLTPRSDTAHQFCCQLLECLGAPSEILSNRRPLLRPLARHLHADPMRPRTLREHLAHRLPKLVRLLGTVRGLFRRCEATTSPLKFA